jgi:hypothetical protein
MAGRVLDWCADWRLLCEVSMSSANGGLRQVKGTVMRGKAFKEELSIGFLNGQEYKFTIQSSEMRKAEPSLHRSQQFWVPLMPSFHSQAHDNWTQQGDVTSVFSYPHPQLQLVMDQIYWGAPKAVVSMCRLSSLSPFPEQRSRTTVFIAFVS